MPRDWTVGGCRVVRRRYLAGARRAVCTPAEPGTGAQTKATVATAAASARGGGPGCIVTPACAGQRERCARGVRDGVSADGLAGAEHVRRGRGRGRPVALRVVAPGTP